MQPFEIIHFTIGGLKLQEPVALITNWLISFFCFFVFVKTEWSESNSSRSFKQFYLWLGISTFFGGLGHLFFHYFGIYGKFPCWITGVAASLFIGKGILFYWKDKPYYQTWNIFLWLKSFAMLLLSLWSHQFIFVAIDAILTYILYSGYLSWKLWKSEKNEMRFFVYGMAVLMPSGFIFLLNINLHRYLNRDDLSHLFMLSCVIIFYLGIKKLNLSYLSKSI
jgi:hypothetical protein